MIGNKEINMTWFFTPREKKEIHAAWHCYKRISPIKRTRKRQIEKAKHMQAWTDHTGYEWSQWWKESTRKPKRWKEK